MVRFMNFVKEQFEKMKSFIKKRKSIIADNQSQQKIVIRSRHDAMPSFEAQSVVFVEETPRITIHNVNQRTPIAFGTSVYRDDIEVQNTNIGSGIIVNRQRKPGRCPLCATRGEIIENPSGNRRWKCNACASLFN